MVGHFNRRPPTVKGFGPSDGLENGPCAGSVLNVEGDDETRKRKRLEIFHGLEHLRNEMLPHADEAPLLPLLPHPVSSPSGLTRLPVTTSSSNVYSVFSGVLDVTLGERHRSHQEQRSANEHHGHALHRLPPVNLPPNTLPENGSRFSEPRPFYFFFSASAAAELFRQATTNAPANCANYYWLGTALFHRMLQLQNSPANPTNQPAAEAALDAAVEALTVAVKLDERHAESHALLGTLYGMKINGSLLRGARFGPRVAKHRGTGD